jgi:hypothetical protein
VRVESPTNIGSESDVTFDNVDANAESVGSMTSDPMIDGASLHDESTTVHRTLMHRLYQCRRKRWHTVTSFP